MCGIFCAVSFRTAFREPEWQQFVRLTDLIAYRGPDDAGYNGFSAQTATATSPGEPFDVFLGLRRLAIIDRSPAGHQPMTDGAGRWIVFNGQIFNYVELRDELQQRGRVFRTASDTEVILQAYAAFGDAAFARFNGMWAFVLLDLPRRKLLVSRDRFSIKPIYYTRAGDRMYFASEIKQLLPLAASREPNLKGLHRFLNQALADDTTATMFANVSAVRPRHTLFLDLATGETAERSYWEFSPAAAPEATTDEFRDVFADAVRIRLRSDVPVGALVSGGLDSSSITVLARKEKSSLPAYALVGREPGYNEEEFIRELERSGTEIHRVELRFSDVVANIDRALYHNDEPPLSFSAIAQFQLLEFVKKNSSAVVLLSGQGGDETLLGYRKFFFFYLRELARKGRLASAAALAAASLAKGTAFRQFRLGPAQRYIATTRPYLMRSDERERLGVESDLRHRQIADIERLSVPVQTHYEDRNSMAHSQEIRTPFLDHRVVETALRLPFALLFRGGWTKYALRQAVPELPRKIRWRRDKQNFLTPEEVWLRRDLRGDIESMFSGSSRLSSMGLVDDACFRDYYRRFLKGDRSVWYADITRAFLAERWARIFAA